MRQYDPKESGFIRKTKRKADKIRRLLDGILLQTHCGLSAQEKSQLEAVISVLKEAEFKLYEKCGYSDSISPEQYFFEGPEFFVRNANYLTKAARLAKEIGREEKAINLYKGAIEECTNAIDSVHEDYTKMREFYKMILKIAEEANIGKEETDELVKRSIKYRKHAGDMVSLDLARPRWNPPIFIGDGWELTGSVKNYLKLKEELKKDYRSLDENVSHLLEQIKKVE